MLLTILRILKNWRNSPTSYLLGLLLACISSIPLSVYAELPLRIEKPLTEQGKWKLETGLTYSNINRSQIAMKEPLLVQTGPSQVVPIPTHVHQEQINQNTLIPSIGLRYGLTPRMELYGKTVWTMSRTRHSNEIKSKITQNHRFEGAWLGINYHLIDHPEVNVLGFMESVLAEQRKSMVYGKTAALGTTFYRSIDPLVLSLTTAYQHHFKDNQELNKDRISGVLMFNPQVSFAANDQITLSSYGPVDYLLQSLSPNETNWSFEFANFLITQSLRPLPAIVLVGIWFCILSIQPKRVNDLENYQKPYWANIKD